MPSRGKKKYSFRTAQMHTQMRAAEGRPGVYELSIALQQLPVPDREFYCNTARYLRRKNFATFVFGQMSSSLQLPNNVQNAVLIDIPYRAIPPLVSTFEPNFRRQLADIVTDLAPMDMYVTESRPLQAVSYPGYVAKLLLNAYLGHIDFYTLEPTLGTNPIVDPVIRIKCLPAVISWFITTCDQLAAEMQDQNPAVEQSAELDVQPKVEP